jgi:hypothetical protein
VTVRRRTDAANSACNDCYALENASPDPRSGAFLDGSLSAEGAVFAVAPKLTLIGRRVSYSPAKAERVLGWKRRREEDTVVACAESLLV